MTQRIMYDALKSNLYRLAHNAPKPDIIAYYLDGSYAVPSIEYVNELFPGIKQNPITVTGANKYARSYDVEKGDIRPEHLESLITQYQEDAPWYKEGGRPVVYCSRDTIPAVRVGTGKYILGKDYYLWVATLDGTQFMGQGVIACQVWDLDYYDKSIVYDPRWLA